MIVKIMKGVILFVALFITAIIQAESKMLAIDHGWIREMPPGVPTAAAYMLITNQSGEDIILIGASSSVSDKAEIHEIRMQDQVMQMRKKDEIVIKKGESVEFAPGKIHLMLVGVKQQLKQGDNIEIELELKDQPPVKINIPVKKE